MACCVAIGCSNRPERKIPGITFHRFPSDIPRRHEWIKNVRRQDWMPSKHSRLCSKHFADNQFDRTSMRCVRLKPHAVPTIFDYFSSHQKQEKKSRKLPAKHLVTEEYIVPSSESQTMDTEKDDTNIKVKKIKLPSKHVIKEEYILPSSEPEIVDSEKEDTNIEKSIKLPAKHEMTEEYILPTSDPETMDAEKEDTNIKEEKTVKLPSKHVTTEEYILPSSEPETMDSEKEDTDLKGKKSRNLPAEHLMTEEYILPTSQPAIVYIKREDISTEVCTTTSPNIEEYKRKLEEAECTKIHLKKKIKILQQQSRRQKRQIMNLKSLLAEYKKKKLVASDQTPKISSTKVNEESLSQKLAKGTNVVILRYMLPN